MDVGGLVWRLVFGHCGMLYLTSGAIAKLIVRKLTAPASTRGIAKKSQRLTPLQAKFILDCLTVDFQNRRETGKKNVSYGLYQRLAKIFDVSPWTIKDIWHRRTFKWIGFSNIYTISARHRCMLLGADDETDEHPKATEI
jgi:hypothetical protein